ncbi:Speriolin-like protein [Plecturocebus cupreus]
MLHDRISLLREYRVFTRLWGREPLVAGEPPPRRGNQRKLNMHTHFGRFTRVPDTPSQLQTSSLEDLLCSHAPVQRGRRVPGLCSPSQAGLKAFLSPPELHSHRGTDGKSSPLLSPGKTHWWTRARWSPGKGPA